MKNVTILFLVSLCAWAQDTAWQARLQYIEACSCNLFCPCYFQGRGYHQHGGENSCNFNNVARVLAGKHGATDLTGVKVWLAGNLGPDWSKGDADWLVATFEPKATKEQKDGMMAILSKLYPVKWKSFQSDTSEIVWQISPDGKTAEARLANGKGSVKLTRFEGADPGKASELHNVKYFGATWNGPFNLYFSDHFYKGFGKSYDLKRANGFTITVEMTSDGKRAAAPKPRTKAD